MNLLGILGGLGPLSSAYFYELITKHTVATCDQDHIDIILSSYASTPDRTDYILEKSEESPVPKMVEGARMLETCGVDAIVIPCNTAHYFIEEVRKSVHVPVPSIIEETVLHIKSIGKTKPLILATEGTIHTESYQSCLNEHGIDFCTPSENDQRIVSHVIYDGVKTGDLSVADDIVSVANSYSKLGCDCAILGCTELSVLKPQLEGKINAIDSMECLANTVIKMFGKQVVGLFG